MTTFSQRVRRWLVCVAVVPSLALIHAGAQAQDPPPDPPILYACYIPQSGVVYRVGEPGLRSETAECVGQNHVLFSWNAKGEKGDPGPQGPPGSGGGDACSVEYRLNALTPIIPRSVQHFFAISPDCQTAGAIIVTEATVEITGGPLSTFSITGTGPPGLPVVGHRSADCFYQTDPMFGEQDIGAGAQREVIAADGTFSILFLVPNMDYTAGAGLLHSVGWNPEGTPVSCSDPFTFTVITP